VNYWLVFSIVSSSFRLPLGVHLNKAGEHRGLGARENRRMGGGSSSWVGSGRNMVKVCNNAYYFTIKKVSNGESQENGQEPGMQSTGDGRFGPPTEKTFTYLDQNKDNA